MKNQLIQIYLLVCNIYDNQSCLKYQRLSNFKPKFSDEEIDLTASREITNELPQGINLFGDKPYADKDFKEELRDRQIQLFTPIRKPKKEELSKVQRKYDKMVSKIRQPIESFFKWLIDKTDIQRASRVRSTEGLLIHRLDKLTFALLLLNFYY